MRQHSKAKDWTEVSMGSAPRSLSPGHSHHAKGRGVKGIEGVGASDSHRRRVSLLAVDHTPDVKWSERYRRRGEGVIRPSV